MYLWFISISDLHKNSKTSQVLSETSHRCFIRHVLIYHHSFCRPATNMITIVSSQLTKTIYTQKLHLQIACGQSVVIKITGYILKCKI